MNYRMISKILGRVMAVDAARMVPPALTAVYYGESPLPFVYTLLIAAALFALLTLPKLRHHDIYAREGFVSVALSWLLMSLVGALPFVFSGEMPNYFDAFFEIVSGFTTTGASVAANVEELTRGSLLWRSLSHWIGGMGVLVFIMAVLPLSEERSMHIMRAEVPGPQVGKLVPRIRHSSAITYLIYVALTVMLVILLCLGGMPFFDSINHAMATAATGGFSVKALSIGYYDSAYIDVVTGVFMLLFGVNFSIYFLLIMRKFRPALRNSELHLYLGIAGFATLAIALDIMGEYGNFWHSLRLSFFQVSSIMTTTGFATADFNHWPAFSKGMLVLLMFIGASAGSTGGGIKVSRILILSRAAKQELGKLLNPRRTVSVRMDGHSLDLTTIRCTLVFFALYITITFLSTLLVSLDGYDLETNFTAVTSCISNVGPGLSLVGPMGNYGMFSNFSKALLSFDMLVGRLEIYPMLILFLPSTWRKN